MLELRDGHVFLREDDWGVELTFRSFRTIMSILFFEIHLT